MQSQQGLDVFGQALSRCGKGTVTSLWHEGLWYEVAGTLGSCLCRLCTKVQLPQVALALTLTSVLNLVCMLSGLIGGPHPLPPITKWICWNYHSLLLFCLTCYDWTITGTARRCILIASTFKWSRHCGADVWCRSKAMSNPKCIFFLLEKVSFSLPLWWFLLSLFLVSSLPEWPQGGWCWDGACMTCPYRNPELNSWMKGGTESQLNLVLCHWFLMWHCTVPLDVQKLLESLWLRSLVHSLAFTPTHASMLEGMLRELTSCCTGLSKEQRSGGHGS